MKDNSPISLRELVIKSVIRRQVRIRQMPKSEARRHIRGCKTTVYKTLKSIGGDENGR